MSLLSITRSINEHHHHEHHTTEKRAPTDESVRLLREVEAEAKAAVVKSVRVANTDIDIVVHKQYDIINDQTLYRMVYSLNGKRRIVNTHVSTGDPVEQHLVHTLSDDIAIGLLSSVSFKDVAA
jgi:hypothetical protein